MFDPVFWTGFATCNFLRYTRNKVLRQHGAVGFLGHIGYGIATGYALSFIYWSAQIALEDSLNEADKAQYKNTLAALNQLEAHEVEFFGEQIKESFRRFNTA